MSIDIEQEFKDLINSKESVKVLATISEKGIPLASFKQYVRFNEDGNIEYLELLEESQSYKNFTRSLWYNEKVSFSISGENSINFQVVGRPIKIIVSGPSFEKNYIDIREKLGDIDLAAVCIINPEEVINQTFYKKFEAQEKFKPVFTHLDRLVK